MMKRLYVLTRNDLGLAYQAVQGAHAVAQFIYNYPDEEWKNGYLIFLAVEDKDELEKWADKLLDDNYYQPQNKRVPFVVFREPDLDNEMTALAAYSNGRKFKDLPIMAQEEIEAVTS